MTINPTFETQVLPGGGWVTGNWREVPGGVPQFDVYEKFGTFQNPIQNPTLPLIFQQGNKVNPMEALDPFSMGGGLAGKYMGMNNGPLFMSPLANLIGSGIKFFGNKR